LVAVDLVELALVLVEAQEQFFTQVPLPLVIQIRFELAKVVGVSLPQTMANQALPQVLETTRPLPVVEQQTTFRLLDTRVVLVAAAPEPMVEQLVVHCSQTMAEFSLPMSIQVAKVQAVAQDLLGLVEAVEVLVVLVAMELHTHAELLAAQVLHLI
jgi:hypothetical protein